ncbi:MAG: hypothetical protein NTZ33_12995 [Bacteroidetes bacterium]|nr:hypothetical protein [Bacteroidota bacterium]
MKKIISISIVLIAAFIFANNGRAQKKPDNWPQKTAFHTVMANTFHPSEEGNLEPIKKRSGEMVQKAEEWMKSTPPAEFNTPKVKEKLKLLYNESVALDKLVKSKASDKKITATLAKLHDRFHEIVEVCKHEDKEDDHKH